jgi:hypothetical protein
LERGGGFPLLRNYSSGFLAGVDRGVVLRYNSPTAYPLIARRVIEAKEEAAKEIARIYDELRRKSGIDEETRAKRKKELPKMQSAIC